MVTAAHEVSTLEYVAEHQCPFMLKSGFDSFIVYVQTHHEVFFSLTGFFPDRMERLRLALLTLRHFIFIIIKELIREDKIVKGYKSQLFKGIN